MLFLKLTGGIMIVICGTLVGLYASLRLKKRVEMFEQYAGFLTQAEAVISYTAVSAEELLAEMKCGEQISPICKEASRELCAGSPPEKAWRRAVDMNIANGGDREILYGFGDDFGTSDVNGELKKLALHKELILQHLSALKSELNTKRRLYRVLGMFGGTMAALMLL